MTVNQAQYAQNLQAQSDRQLEAKLELIQRQLEFVTEQLNKGKGKRPIQTPPQPSPSGNILNRLRSSFSGPGTSDQLSTDSHEDEEPPSYSLVDPDPPQPVPVTKTIWIKKVELLLNGIALDQLDITESEVHHVIRGASCNPRHI